MSDKTPKSHRRPKPTLMWRVREWFDRLLRGVGKRLGGAAESSEWMMHRLASLFMPWTWFRGRNDEFEEFPRERGSSSIESFEYFFHRITSAIALVFMPWRWFGQPDRNAEATEAITGERPGSLSERFEWILGTFFEKCGDIGRTIGQILLPRQVVKTTEDVQHALTKKTLKTSYKVRKRFEAFADRFLPKRIFWPLYWLGRQSWNCFDFVSEWWWSREYARLTWAVPALVLVLPIATTMVMTLWNTPSRKMQHYQRALAQSQDSGEEDDQSLLLKRKLDQLGYQRLDMMEFRAALELDQNGNIEDAYAKMRGIASTAEPGLLEAHLWIATQVLQQRIQLDSPLDPWEVFEKHTQHALTLAPRNSLAKRYRVETLMHKGHFQEAATEMEALTDEFPDFHATLVHVYQSLGNAQKSRYHAKRAVTYYDRLTERLDRTDSVANNLPSEALGDDQLGNSMVSNSGENDADTQEPLTVLGFLRMADVFRLVDLDRELEILEQGGQQYPDDETLQSRLVETRLQRLTQYRYTDTRMLKLMDRICRVDPDNEDVVRTLVRGLLANETPNDVSKIGLRLSAIREDLGNAAKAAEQIRVHLQNEGLLSAKVYLRLGNFYLVQGDLPRAKRYLEETCKLDSNVAEAWNNLGWLLTQEPFNDLPRALKVANRAIEIQPDVRFMETRSQILMKLERWDEAAKDLETALAGAFHKPIQAHRSLATCYEYMGLHEQAAAHRRIVEDAKK